MDTDLNQLAIDWLAVADADEIDSNAAPMQSIRDRLCGQVMAKRNCAWELQRLLRQMEKENPPSGGPLVSHADSESA